MPLNMNIHFIAIGGAAMHNLAIALHLQGNTVTGSDDEIVDPSRSKLLRHGLLPEQNGWFPENISSSLDAIVLGMHARKDNPELLKAQQLGLRIYSYPEFVYEHARNKKRVVIAGSHGKTTITSMVLHVLNDLNMDFDYLVGAQLEGFENMVKLTDAPVIVLEGDEYLSSPIDLRPKFTWYKPHIALISGIAWDHINVFPTFEEYSAQFEAFIQSIEPNGALIYYSGDRTLSAMHDKNPDIRQIPYETPAYVVENGTTYLQQGKSNTAIHVFGEHNLQNLNGAKEICVELGISETTFYKSISSFKGAARRLELIAESQHCKVYKDFAHSPSKLKATVKACKLQYPDRALVACMELHTFSSLNKAFLPEYKNCMAAADEAIVYYNPHTVAHKKLETISPDEIKTAFDQEGLRVFTDSKALQNELKSRSWKDNTLLLMSSGNFDGIELNSFAKELLAQ
jgi:UDP-N-acetylmuramate: L-alanyl-gamma-D-glutamyl-meso-diaminopimelate ligase